MGGRSARSSPVARKELQTLAPSAPLASVAPRVRRTFTVRRPHRTTWYPRTDPELTSVRVNGESEMQDGESEGETCLA